MSQIIKEITLDLSKPNLIQTFTAKQGDVDSRFLKVKFVCDDAEVAISSDSSVKINAFRRFDGMADSFDGEVNEDNTVLVPLHQWMLEFEGLVESDVSVFNGDKKLTSPTFHVKVEKAVNVDNTSFFNQSIAFYEGESTVFYNPYITKVGEGVFYSEQLATEIDLPNVTEIETYGIYSCVNLAKVNLPQVTTLATYALAHNSKLAEVHLPNLETAKENAFRKSTSLVSITLPKAKNIAGYCFRGCTALERIILPSIEQFGGMPFQECSAMREIIITNENTMPVVSNGLFAYSQEDWTQYPNLQAIYVPDALVDTYKSSTNWARYVDFIKPLSEWEGAE